MKFRSQLLGSLAYFSGTRKGPLDTFLKPALMTLLNFAQAGTCKSDRSLDFGCQRFTDQSQDGVTHVRVEKPVDSKLKIT